MTTQHLQIPIWKRYLLRVSILFILFLSIPLQVDFYRILFTVSWQNYLTDIFNLVIFLPHYFGEQSSLYDWFLLLAIALVLGLLWVKKDKEDLKKEFTYYYYLRIFARFKLAAILFVAGFIKVFPVFVPELSLSHLNTGYGYFEHWKHLLLSLSAAPAYLVFLGIVEVITALLLLFRKTSFLAVIFVIPFYGNAFLADLAYEGPTHLVSTYIVLLTLPIFLYDVQRLGKLIVNFQYTQPASWVFDWDTVKYRKWKTPLKAVFSLLFVILVGIKSYSTYGSSSLHYPEQAGIPDIEGKYVVDVFVLNGDTLSFSPTDKIRWKDVVFEKWNTLSVRVNDSVRVVPPKGLLTRVNDERSYEYSQVGDRLYYRYDVTGEGRIDLKNPNPLYPGDEYRFQLVRPDSTHVLLNGVNLRGDTLFVALNKVDKKYLLQEVKKVGRRRLGYKL